MNPENSVVMAELRRFVEVGPANPEDYNTEEEKAMVKGFEKARSIVARIMSGELPRERTMAEVWDANPQFAQAFKEQIGRSS